MPQAPSKSVTHTPTELITYTSTIPYTEARTRLELYIKRTASLEQGVLAKIRDAKTAEELTKAVDDVTQGDDFLFFQEFTLNTFLSVLTGRTIPPAKGYIFGNPLIARFILERDLTGGTFIPPRLLLREHEYQGHSSGKRLVTIQYHKPSTLLPRAHLDRDKELKTQVEGLDAKIEKMVLEVLDENAPVQSKL